MITERTSRNIDFSGFCKINLYIQKNCDYHYKLGENDKQFRKADKKKTTKKTNLSHKGRNVTSDFESKTKNIREKIIENISFLAI